MNWDKGSAAKYLAAKHGADGRALLDDILARLIAEHAKGLSVFDGGCGAGRFLEALVSAGASYLEACDINPEMISLAGKAMEAIAEKPPNHVYVGDVGDLSEVDESSFDRYFSFNVGCNLEILGPMFSEARRILKSAGKLIVSGPANLNQLFLRDGVDSEEVVRAINAELLRTNDPKSIAGFNHVFRATIIEDEGGYRLVRPDERLVPGTLIYRKLAGIGDNPGLVVPNRWHAVCEYEDAANAAGFVLDKEFGEKFFSPRQRVEYNNDVPETDRLGKLYETHNPFFVMVFKSKQA